MSLSAVIKSSISVGAAILIVVHALRPDIEVDAITLGLIIIAALPWLTSVVESVELPGGWKVKLRDVAAAGQKVVGLSMITSVHEAAVPYGSAVERDPNLELVALRIQIEERLRALAERFELPLNRPLAQLVRMLRDREILEREAAAGLQDLIAAGNNAAHGAKVEPAAASWAREYGPVILHALDAVLHERR